MTHKSTVAAAYSRERRRRTVHLSPLVDAVVVSVEVDGAAVVVTGAVVLVVVVVESASPPTDALSSSSSSSDAADVVVEVEVGVAVVAVGAFVVVVVVVVSSSSEAESASVEGAVVVVVVVVVELPEPLPAIVMSAHVGYVWLATDEYHQNCSAQSPALSQPVTVVGIVACTVNVPAAVAKLSKCAICVSTLYVMAPAESVLGLTMLRFM